MEMYGQDPEPERAPVMALVWKLSFICGFLIITAAILRLGINYGLIVWIPLAIMICAIASIVLIARNIRLRKDNFTQDSVTIELERRAERRR